MGRGRPRKWTPENPKPKKTPLCVTGSKQMDRKEWLKYHPEDIPLDQENMAARQRGWDNDGFRSLIAAVCLRTVIDYKNALTKDTYYIDGRQYAPTSKKTERIIESCEEAFADDLFEFFTNGIDPKDIAKIIQDTPGEKLRGISNTLGRLRNEESQKMQGLL